MTLDERVAALFVRRLGALEPAVLTSLASGLDAGAPRATVRTAFEPSALQRETLRGAVGTALSPGRKDATGSTIDVVFETAPDLLGGIELVVGGRKLEWNVSEYMDALEQVLDPATHTTHPDNQDAVPTDTAASVAETVA